MKCVLCEKRKPKRYCPAKRASICPTCCGQKRGVEINCPPDCKYFVEGQKHHGQKVMRQRVKKQGARSYVRKAKLYQQNPEIFAKMEKCLADMFRNNRAIENADVVSALDAVKKTLYTEKKGLLFQHEGRNSNSNQLSSSILAVISEFKDNPDLGANRIDLEYSIAVVDEFLKEADFYAEKDSEPHSYLIHLLRYYPEEMVEDAAPDGLIITP